jgi:hypothetical protein
MKLSIVMHTQTSEALKCNGHAELYMSFILYAATTNLYAVINLAKLEEDTVIVWSTRN